MPLWPTEYTELHPAGRRILPRHHDFAVQFKRTPRPRPTPRPTFDIRNLCLRGHGIYINRVRPAYMDKIVLQESWHTDRENGSNQQGMSLRPGSSNSTSHFVLGYHHRSRPCRPCSCSPSSRYKQHLCDGVRIKGATHPPWRRHQHPGQWCATSRPTGGV